MKKIIILIICIIILLLGLSIARPWSLFLLPKVHNEVEKLEKFPYGKKRDLWNQSYLIISSLENTYFISSGCDRKYDFDYHHLLNNEGLSTLPTNDIIIIINTNSTNVVSEVIPLCYYRKSVLSYFLSYFSKECSI